jgi:hypothetical protein
MVSSFPQTSSARLTGDPVSRIAQEYKEIGRTSMLVPELISLRSAASSRPSTSLAALSGISDMEITLARVYRIGQRSRSILLANVEIRRSVPPAKVPPAPTTAFTRPSWKRPTATRNW